MPIIQAAVNTCALYGATTYTNNFLLVNLLVILASVLVVAITYSASSIFPRETQAKIKGVAKFEIIQLLISCFIIAVVVGLAATACNISSTASMSYYQTSLNPFQYSDYYLGTLLNKGLDLLTNLYSTTVSYAVFAQVLKLDGWTGISNLVLKGNIGSLVTKAIVQKVLVPSFANNYIHIGLAKGFGGLGDLFAGTASLASIYLGLFGGILLIAVGLMFVQFLLIPTIQYSAFIIVLPVALAMRSLAFASPTIGQTANALIAIAIALYLIYPMMIAFDSYVVAWTFSAQNPSYQYLSSNGAYLVSNIQPSTFFTQAPCTNCGPLAAAFTTVLPFIFQSSIYGQRGFQLTYPPIFTAMSTLQLYVDETAQYLFVAVLLFALNIAITIGFAISLWRALSSGLGESARFW